MAVRPGLPQPAPSGPVSITEDPDSRIWSWSSRHKQVVRNFTFKGSAFDYGPANSVIVYVVNHALPDESGSHALGFFFGGLYRRNFDAWPVFVDETKHEDTSIWKIKVTYSNAERVEREFDSGGFEFDTTPETLRITQSLQTKAAAAPTGFDANTNDWMGSINANKNGEIEGAEILGGTFKFSVNRQIPLSWVTPQWIRDLEMLSEPRVNNADLSILVVPPNLDNPNGVAAPFLAGELLFMGAEGSQLGRGMFSVTFRFAGAGNESIVDVGSGTPNHFTIGPKDGWDLLWIYYDDVDPPAGTSFVRPVKAPVAAYIEKVYRRGDFSLLWPF